MNAKALPLLFPLLLLAAAGLFWATGNSETAPQQAPVVIGDAVPPRSSLEDAEYAAFDFDEVFVTPAGPKGLEYTARAQSLNGKKVKMCGYMIRHFSEDPSIILFASYQASYNQKEEMLADTLPTSLVHVILPVRPGQAPDWYRGKMNVYGTLELGRRQEQDGRVSWARLISEEVTDLNKAPLELRRPLSLQRGRLSTRLAAEPRDSQHTLSATPRRSHPNITP